MGATRHFRKLFMGNICLGDSMPLSWTVKNYKASGSATLSNFIECLMVEQVTQHLNDMRLTPKDECQQSELWKSVITIGAVTMRAHQLAWRQSQCTVQTDVLSGRKRQHTIRASDACWRGRSESRAGIEQGRTRGLKYGLWWIQQQAAACLYTAATNVWCQYCWQSISVRPKCK